MGNEEFVPHQARRIILLSREHTQDRVLCKACPFACFYVSECMITTS